jgi:hypothetical protein
MKTVCALLLVVVGCAQEENLGNTPFQDRAAWSLALGGRGYENGKAVAINAAGDVIVGGDGYEGTIDFGSGATGNLGRWAFIAMRSGSTGAAIWEHTITGVESGASVDLTDLALATDGSVYVTGTYTGSVDFGGVSLATEVARNGDMFVAKYTSDGALVWVDGLGTLSNAYAQGLCVDGFDNVYVGGIYDLGTFTLLGTTYTSTTDNQVGFVVSYSRDGTPRWLNSFDPTAATFVSAIATSPTGDVVFVGLITSATNFGGEILQPPSSPQGFLARYRADGSYVWARTIGESNTSTVLRGVLVDSNDRIVVEKFSFEGTADHQQSLATFGPGGDAESNYPLDTVTTANAVIADGTLVSSQWIDAVYDSDHPDLATGHLELTSVTPAGDVVTSNIGKRLSPAGNENGVRRIAVGPSGELAIVGDLAGEILIGPTAITAHGTNDTDALLILIPPTH